MKLKYRIYILFFFTFLSSLLFSQSKSSKWDKEFPTVYYGENVYKTGSNWFTAAYGGSYHTNKNTFNHSISLVYHHRFKAMYFSGGFHNSSPKFFFHNKVMEKLTDFHVGAGLRFEGRWYNFDFFIGPSFAVTWVPIDASVSRINYLLGAVTQVDFTFKYLYDLGIGTSLYGSFNKRYQVIGLQVHFYFSNAFKAKY